MEVLIWISLVVFSVAYVWASCWIFEHQGRRARLCSGDIYNHYEDRSSHLHQTMILIPPHEYRSR